MLNKAMIIGRLGKDPEVRQAANGAVCNLSVATDESYMGRDGQKVERTEWHRVTCFGKTAENVARYLAKGSLVYVEGRILTRKWQDQSGQDRFSTEINANVVRFLDKRSDGGQQKADDYSFYSGTREMDEAPL